jgi:hypothetical protein
MTRNAWLVVVMVGWCAAACGSDTDDSASDDSASDNSASDNSAARCTRGCVATLAANCSNGPATQTVCEADCVRLASGACAAEYEALAECADGEVLTCSPNGIPVVAACATQQQAMVACLTGM